MRRQYLWVLAALFLLFLIAAISIPNLLRSRISAEMASKLAATRGRGFLLPAAAEAADATSPGTKIVGSATLDLVCRGVPEAVDSIRKITSSLGGYVENLELTGGSDDNRTAHFILRVPASGLDRALDELKRTAIRVGRENVKSEDVTRRYVDTESRLRNYHAEEQQYLAIMKRAASVKDTLQVAEKLSDVRGRIEQVQGELNYLSRQVEMATINVSVSQQISGAASWRPGENARRAWREMLSALGDYADTMVALIVWLPVVLAWFATIGAVSLAGWKLFRWLRRRMAVAHGPVS